MAIMVALFLVEAFICLAEKAPAWFGISQYLYNIMFIMFGLPMDIYACCKIAGMEL